MSRRSLVDLVLNLYPKAWRQRYGEEVRDLMSEVNEHGDSSSSRATLGLISSALAWRLRTSWRSLAFTGAILAFAAGAVLIVNSVEHVQPSQIAVATHTTHQRVRPQSEPSQPAHAPTGGAVAQTPKVGPIPQSAFLSNGIDQSQVPDFIPALSGGRVVGFIPKAQLFPSAPAPNLGSPAADIAAQNAALVHTVYASDLTTVVGHWYPGVGFVPVGETPPPPTTPIISSTPPPGNS